MHGICTDAKKINKITMWFKLWIKDILIAHQKYFRKTNIYIFTSRSENFPLFNQYDKRLVGIMSNISSL